MKIVSPTNTIRYGIVGDGKVACHFANYFNQINISYKLWSRRTQSKLSMSLENFFLDCDVVLVLIKDSAIENFISKKKFLKEKRVIHFSGSLVIESAQGMHPLMSFNDRFYDLKTYKEIPFVVEEGKYSFTEIFPKLENRSCIIESSKKSLYHAMCVMGCNFPAILITRYLSELSQLGIDKDFAIPIIKKTINNILEQGETSLTGPFDRKDYSTIDNNLTALLGDDISEIYMSFVKKFMPEYFTNYKQFENECGKKL